MAWWMLFAAGVLEIVWALGLKATDGFTRVVPTVVTLASMGASIWLLGLAAKQIPIGTAYVVWVGIGAVGASVGGMLLHGEPATFVRLSLLMVIAAAVVGLKLTA